MQRYLYTDKMASLKYRLKGKFNKGSLIKSGGQGFVFYEKREEGSRGSFWRERCFTKFWMLTLKM